MSLEVVEWRGCKDQQPRACGRWQRCRHLTKRYRSLLLEQSSSRGVCRSYSQASTTMSRLLGSCWCLCRSRPSLRSLPCCCYHYYWPLSWCCRILWQPCFLKVVMDLNSGLKSRNRCRARMCNEKRFLVAHIFHSHLWPSSTFHWMSFTELVTLKVFLNVLLKVTYEKLDPTTSSEASWWHERQDSEESECEVMHFCRNTAWKTSWYKIQLITFFCQF